jgi:hypothetical protein
MRLTLWTAAALAVGAALAAGCRPARPTADTARGADAKAGPGPADRAAKNPRTKTPGPADPIAADPRPKAKGGVVYLKDGEGTYRVNDVGRVDLAPGGSRTVEVAVVREGGFASEIKFSLRPPPGVKGVTFGPADWQLDGRQTSQTVTARAEPGATVGTFTWTLIARPRVGPEQTRTFTVVVGPKG